MVAAASGHSGLVGVLSQLGARLDMVDSQVDPTPPPPPQIGAFCATVESITTKRGSSTIEPLLGGMRVFWGFPDPDPLVRGTELAQDPSFFLIKMFSGLKYSMQKKSKKFYF
jgi:hypothetical protein